MFCLSVNLLNQSYRDVIGAALVSVPGNGLHAYGGDNASEAPKPLHLRSILLTYYFTIPKSYNVLHLQKNNELKTF